MNVINNLIASSWKSLSLEQRNMWQAHVDFAKPVNKRNSNINLSGRSWFFQYNTIRYLAINNIQLEPEFSTTLFTPITATLEDREGVLYLVLNRAIDFPNEFINFYISAPKPESWSPRRSSVRFLPFDQNSAHEFDITDVYKSIFGVKPSRGDFVDWKLKQAGGATFATVNHYGINKEEIK